MAVTREEVKSFKTKGYRHGQRRAANELRNKGIIVSAGASGCGIISSSKVFGLRGCLSLIGCQGDLY